MTANPVYVKQGNSVVFRQLGVKVEMDSVSIVDYYRWLDEITPRVGELVPGAEIAEKADARLAPPLNTAIYYDTPDYRVLPTGALLRTSCNRITHAFCAFKASEDSEGIREDHRHVFEAVQKRTIQVAPASPEAVGIVKGLLARTDIDHPGRSLQRGYGIDPTTLEPSVQLDSYRYTFFAWLDRKDALRCSIDRYQVSNLRLPPATREFKSISEVELAIYPRIAQEIAEDPRVPELIAALARSLEERFGVRQTKEIKYQRAARALGITATGT
jgi:hypothetical protein